MAKLEFGVIHCTATPEGRDTKAKAILDYHLRAIAKGGRGWTRPGYSAIVELDGTVVTLRPYDEDAIVEDHEITWGAVGINHKSIHVCYVGGVDVKGIPKDTRTNAQKLALEVIVKDWIRKWPWIKIIGHYDVARKACPSFPVAKWLREIGIPEANIGGK